MNRFAILAWGCEVRQREEYSSVAGNALNASSGTLIMGIWRVAMARVWGDGEQEGDHRH
jgi:hypothetical protein